MKNSEAILKDLREAIENGQIQVKVSKTSGNYKITELTDLLSGYKLTPEHIVPKPKEVVIKYCELCKEKINLQQVYSTRQEKGSEIIKYYHSKCRLLEGTTSNDHNWNGEIK